MNEKPENDDGPQHRHIKIKGRKDSPEDNTEQPVKIVHGFNEAGQPKKVSKEVVHESENDKEYRQIAADVVNHTDPQSQKFAFRGVIDLIDNIETQPFSLVNIKEAVIEKLDFINNELLLIGDELRISAQDVDATFEVLVKDFDIINQMGNQSLKKTFILNILNTGKMRIIAPIFKEKVYRVFGISTERGEGAVMNKETVDEEGKKRYKAQQFLEQEKGNLLDPNSSDFKFIKLYTSLNDIADSFDNWGSALDEMNLELKRNLDSINAQVGLSLEGLEITEAELESYFGSLLAKIDAVRTQQDDAVIYNVIKNSLNNSNTGIFLLKKILFAPLCKMFIPKYFSKVLRNRTDGGFDADSVREVGHVPYQNNDFEGHNMPVKKVSNPREKGGLGARIGTFLSDFLRRE